MRSALLALSLAAFAAGACSRGEGKDASPTAVPSAIATATAAPAPTVTPDAVGGPAVDGARALEHVRTLSVDIGPRVAGTADEITARDYLKAELESYGYDVTTPEFEFDASLFLPVSVDLNGEEILGVALQGTGTGTVTAPVVVAGIGRPEDFPPSGTGGAIALIERGDLSFGEKARNAVAAGAAGVIVYNNETGSIVGDLGDRVDIPVAGIRQADGQALVARVTAGPVEATIVINNPQTTAYNVVAKPRGVSTCTTVTGGHYDSVPTTGAADDNASGTAAVLETARVAVARKLPGANCFVLFGAEEFGLYGSRDFVNDLSDEELNALRAMINLDVVGLPQDLELIGSEDMVRQAGIVADSLGLPSRSSFVPSGAGSDHLSFQDAGVPAVFLYRDDPVIHTPEDAIDRISPDSLAQTAEVAAGLLVELGN
ncbi:MAG: M28 family peptidase [Chloroflexi bacterium]|nr:M28 family peptidase [Chloroflexota bacterium]